VVQGMAGPVGVHPDHVDRGGGDVVLELGLGQSEVADLPRAFRTADLRLIHAAICCSRYSLWTCRGVRY
jgi:hypothetical protein